MSKPFDRPAVVLEDTYDKLIELYNQTTKKEKKKWKHSMTLMDGSLVNVFYDGGLFKFNNKGCMYAIIGEESAKKNGVNLNHPGREAFWEEVDNNHTGNHTPKNHPVKIPTKPSEPVRG